jgi:PIN domain nuclease of toxin-antitoxin system
MSTLQRACIDTHALVWYLTRPARLAKKAARFLRQADAGRATVLVPAIVLVELSLLREGGRKTVGPAELDALFAAQPAFVPLPLDVAQARDFALLAGLEDPFDRLVAAAARTMGAQLITADITLHESALVDVLWD